MSVWVNKFAGVEQDVAEIGERGVGIRIAGCGLLLEKFPCGHSLGFAGQPGEGKLAGAFHLLGRTGRRLRG